MSNLLSVGLRWHLIFYLELKLLKPGRSYPLGRKPKHAFQLVLSHPKISGEHVTFIVGENSIDSVVSYNPKIHIHFVETTLTPKDAHLSKGIVGVWGGAKQQTGIHLILNVS